MSNDLIFDFVSSSIIAFIISIFFYIVYKGFYPNPPTFVRRPPKKLVRYRQEFKYLTKQDLSGFKYFLPVVLVVTFMVFATAVASNIGIQNSLWYYPSLSISAAIIIAIVIYAVNRKAYREILSSIRKVEGLVHMKLDPENEGKDSARFHIGYALEGILYNISEITKEVKQWGRESTRGGKNLIEKRCYNLWDNSLCHYAKIIIDPKIVSPLFFDSDIINKLKLISEQCSINLRFDEKQNQCIHTGINLIIIRSLLVLDILKIETKYKDMIT